MAARTTQCIKLHRSAQLPAMQRVQHRIAVRMPHMAPLTLVP